MRQIPFSVEQIGIWQGKIVNMARLSMADHAFLYSRLANGLRRRSAL
jgi:hypothetical protein